MSYKGGEHKLPHSEHVVTLKKYLTRGAKKAYNGSFMKDLKVSAADANNTDSMKVGVVDYDLAIEALVLNMIQKINNGATAVNVDFLDGLDDRDYEFLKELIVPVLSDDKEDKKKG